MAITTASLLDQLRTAIERDRGRHKAFIAYLQPFSNTYGPRKRLEAIYEPLIAVPGVVGLAIGTRPDCFDTDIYDYLEAVSKRTYLSIEIGLQSGNDAALSFNKRGHDVRAFAKAVTELSGRGIETVAHVMIGLPSSSSGSNTIGADAVATARLLASLPLSGVKIHQLMIIRGTIMHQWYEKGEVAPLSLDEYADVVCDFLSHLRPDQLIHRIMADSTEKCGLVAPLWSAEKMKSIQRIHEKMDQRNLVQGENYGDH